jgi:hypothetical protein
MTAPGGARTLCNGQLKGPPRARLTGFSHQGSELSVYLAPAFIMLVLLAALYRAIIHQRGLRFAPPR